MHATTKPAQLHLLDYDIPLAPKPLVKEFIAEIKGMPIGLQAWFGFLLALMAVMGLAALVSLPPGWEVFGTTPAFEWGLMIIGYVFFAIMTSGLCLASSLGTVFGIERFTPFEKRHAILAILSLTTAFLIIALDLHYPIRMIFGAVFVPSPSSPMWWMGVFYGGYLLVLLVEVWSMFTPHPKIHQYACTLAAVIAILAPFTLGAVFGVMNAKAFWFGIFTPILMVASAFLAGTCLLGIVFYVVHKLRLADFERAAPIALPSARILMVVGIVLVSVLLARQVVAGLNSTERGLPEAIEALLVGPLAPLFWARILLGLGLPTLLIVFPWGRLPGVVFTASVLGLAGIAIDRFLLVAAGQVAPITPSGGTVSYPYAAYTPTVVELAIFVGAGAFMAFLYTLAERYLDMGEGDKHIFFPWPWIKRHDQEDEPNEVAGAEHEVTGAGAGHEVEHEPAADAGVGTGIPVGAQGAGS